MTPEGGCLSGHMAHRCVAGAYDASVIVQRSCCLSANPVDASCDPENSVMDSINAPCLQGQHADLAGCVVTGMGWTRTLSSGAREGGPLLAQRLWYEEFLILKLPLSPRTRRTEL